MNSIVITYINTILSLKNSSPDYDELFAYIAKQCIDNYVMPLTYIINIFPSELKLAKIVPIFNLENLIKLLNIDRYLCYPSFQQYLKKKICIIMLAILWKKIIQPINISLDSGKITLLKRYHNTC